MTRANSAPWFTKAGAATSIMPISHFVGANIFALKGGGYTRFAEASQSRRPDTISWSDVYGYRPAKLRRGYDQCDYRGFAELTGEHTGNVRTLGADLPNSSTTTVWLGPSILAIFKTVSISAGVQAPIYRDASDSLYGREHVRFALNFSYLKFSAHNSSH